MGTKPFEPRSDVVERRRHRRAALAARAWIDRVEGDRLPVVVCDLSAGGMRVALQAPPWEIGTMLRVGLRLPDAVDEIAVRAVVVWRSDDEVGFGFEHIPFVDAVLIDQTVHEVVDEIDSLEDARTPSDPLG